MIGYSLILSCTVSFLLMLIGMPFIADSLYANGIPRVNIMKEYFALAYSFSSFYFLIMVSTSFCYRIISSGYYDIAVGIVVKFSKIYFSFSIVMCLSLMLIVGLFTYTSIDILACDFFFIIFVLINCLFFWAKFVTFLSEFKNNLTLKLEKAEKGKRIFNNVFISKILNIYLLSHI